VHLLGQALVAGAALLAIFGVVIPSNPATTVLLHDMVLWGLLVNMFSILVGELWMPHGTQDTAQAARLILRGGIQSALLGPGHRGGPRPARLASGPDPGSPYWRDVPGRAMCPGQVTRVRTYLAYCRPKCAVDLIGLEGFER